MSTREQSMPLPTSITHLHLLSALNTDSQGINEFRVLDVGCGTGKMLSYFATAFPNLRPGTCVELYGMDVRSVGFDNIDGFFSFAPNIKIIQPGAAWPYPNGHFDFVVSNQVLEHVKDADFFFSQVHRVLRDGGVSYHLFPLKNVLWEGHLLMPLAHRIVEHDEQVRWICLMQKMGFSKRLPPERAADSLLYYTHYRSRVELLNIIKRAGLRPSFRYTAEYYTAKLRSLLKMKPHYLYRNGRTGWLTLKFLSYLSSITVRVEKKNLHD
jgi:SAM-dependent methyltransferase